MARVGGRHYTKLAHSRGRRWLWWWGASVSQPSSLGRREKEKSERRYIQNLISHCFSASLSNSSLHARQWTAKERITSTLSGLSFTLLWLCHVTLVLPSSLEIISFYLFFFHPFRILLYNYRILLLRWQQNLPDAYGDTGWPLMRKH